MSLFEKIRIGLPSILLVCILIAAVIVPSVLAEGPIRYETPNMENTAETYERLKAGEAFSLDIDMTPEEVSEYVNGLSSLYPYAFNAAPKCPWDMRYMSLGDRALRLDFSPDDTGFFKRFKSTEEEVKVITEKAAKEDTDAEKIKVVNDEIKKRCTYSKEGRYKREAYGCLVEGEAVCAGYAESFAWCMTELGIKNRYKFNKKETHVWNQVYIDYKDSPRWWNVDVTWNDRALLDGYLLIEDHDRPKAGGYLRECLKQKIIRLLEQ